MTGLSICETRIYQIQCCTYHTLLLMDAHEMPNNVCQAPRFQQPNSPNFTNFQYSTSLQHSRQNLTDNLARMGRTLGSALTLSTIGLGSKLAVKWLAKRFDVRGLPTLLNALKEPDREVSRKGKEKEESERPRTKRRGIVTSMYMVGTQLMISM